MPLKYLVLLLTVKYSLCFLSSAELKQSFDFLFPTSSAVKNEKCKQHSLLYKKELGKFTYWATEMFDASAKFPSGVLSGSTYHLGNFDECVNIRVPLEDDEILTGKYCLPTISIDIPPVETFLQNEDNRTEVFQSTWNKILLYATDRSKKPRNEIRWAICMPSSCTGEDLLVHLKESISTSKMAYKQMNVTLGKNACQILEPVQYNMLDNLMRCILYLILVLVITSTVYEIKCRKKEHPQSVIHQCLISFSIISNAAKLCTITKHPDKLEIAHGVRFYGMFFTVMAHRIMYSLGSPVTNADGVEHLYTYKLGAGLLNGSILIDIFYSLSGFLAAFLMLDMLHKGQRINYFTVCLHRIIRLTPLYAVVILFYSTLFIHSSSGPVWKEKVGLEMERCQKSWWINLLYLNNYIGKDNLCIIQSWFLAATMQMYYFSPFIALRLYKKPRQTMNFLKITVFLCVVITFLQVYITKLDPTLLTYYNILKDVSLDVSFKTIYTPTHNRISAYLVGMMGGYLRYKMREENLNIPRQYVNAGWLFTAVSMLGGMYTGYIFYVPGRPYNAFESALYSSVHHILISASIVWIILAGSYNRAKYISAIAESKSIIILSRLTYSVYLCHVGVQMFITSSMRVPYYTSITNFLWLFIADVVVIYTIGFFLSMCIEMPFINLENVINGKGVKSYLIQCRIKKEEEKKE